MQEPDYDFMYDTARDIALVDMAITEPYRCQSYFDDTNVLQDCTCGECA